jgi:hypothetical protein
MNLNLGERSVINKTEFLKLVEEQLSNIFKQVQVGNKPDKQKYRTEGFMQAGRILGLVNEEELTKLMEKLHFEIFEMTIKEREQKKLELNQKIQEDDYEMLDVPTFIRNYREQNKN